MTDVKTKSTAKPSMLLVVSASAAGTAFEWYDFFVFVPLASILAKTFAAGLNEAAGYVFALGAGSETGRAARARSWSPSP